MKHRHDSEGFYRFRRDKKSHETVKQRLVKT